MVRMIEIYKMPQGKACAMDRKILAPHQNDVQIYIFDSIEA